MTKTVKLTPLEEAEAALVAQLNAAALSEADFGLALFPSFLVQKDPETGLQTGLDLSDEAFQLLAGGGNKTNHQLEFILGLPEDII